MLADEPVDRYMTSAVLSIDIDSPAGEILRLFAGYAVHHLPVLNGTKVVGMISSADVLKLEAFLPKHQSADPAAYLSQRFHVAQVMRQPPITMTGDQSMEVAARLMVENGIHSLPVTTAAQDLIGIITSTDIMHAALFPRRYGSSQGGNVTEGIPAEARMSPVQLSEALQLAATMAQSNDDCGRISRGLLQVQSRLKLLEGVLSAADRYIRAGQDERLHSVLVKAIEGAREG